MSLSPRRRMLTGFALANFALAIIAVTVVLGRPATPPVIQGVLLPQAKDLQAFSLIDHRNQLFNNQHLLGQWHLVSYGFTSCPDVCPTTLAQLATMTTRLSKQGSSDLRVLFYTVDHRRDTARQLAEYMPFFDPAFVGLTHRDDSANPHLAFETGLGIMAKLTPTDLSANGSRDNEYQVSHGVTLFLLNDQGQLQAIFEPGEDVHGNKVFNADKILADYRNIRNYLG